MEMWTDGTLVVQACESTGTVRALRDFAVIGESKAEHLGWKTPLAVDVTADRIWAGHRLQEFRLSDVSPVATHEDRVWRVAGLGGGRLAAVLPPVDGVCRLAVGQPGRWEREVPLDDLGDAAPGLAATGDRPVSRAIGGDPTLTATADGLVVADGQRGVVAHFSPDLELLGLWYSGGADEADLTGYAAARGVLVTARWAARDSRVGWLTPSGAEHLRDSYSAFAMPAGDDRVWLVGGFKVELLSHDGTSVASARAPRGLVEAAHASGPWCAIGTTDSVQISAATDDRIAVRTISVGGLVDMVATFDGDFNDAARSLVMGAISRHSAGHGCSFHEAEDHQVHVLLPKVRPGAEDDVEQAVLAAGATHVGIGDPTRSPKCCSSRLAR
ncbi:hypothetical protein DFP74_1353 [Nocardiopsis sp. Huas11]|uniref:hypothetical protein n=1 Tax=Nocardiopsis sp. Huas11 TaxID=2183912 RepID=UPI000F1D9A16|nr:hypothetical protein [Nocardiopsis sp. Huas11]RKS05744.1 hypothetical protein DFP74_1353 [Nocardiopsis sp. Huas11]